MSHHDAFFDDGPPISQLQAAVRSLESYVHAVVPAERPTTAARATTTASQAPTLTPVQLFSRQGLVAHKWKELGRAHVAVCGLGGMGAIAADALARAGVGRVLLVDHEPVRWSCMGRAGFVPEEVGFSRAQALRLKLQSIRPLTSDAALAVESFSVDWRSDADLAELRKKLKVSSIGAPVGRPAMTRSAADDDEDDESDDNNREKDPGSSRGSTIGGGLGLFEALTQRRPYDAVVACLEDDTDRLALNEICLELSLPLLHASLSPCNSKISIRTVLSGHTCCLACTIETPQHHQATPNAMEQVTRSIAKAFPASLPHVDLMAGGLLGQHVIKFLLETGDFVPCFTVNALTFEIESYSFPPNRMCANATCRQRQEDEQEHAATR